MSKNSKGPACRQAGFTLVELLMVISILAVLTVVGFVVFTGVQKGARDSKRRADVEAIAKAYETNYQDGSYQTLIASQFAAGTIPQPPEGGNYYNVFATDGSGFRVCAALENHPSRLCNTPSTTCYCLNSSQGAIADNTPITGTGSEIGLDLNHPTSCDPNQTLDDGLIGYWRMDESSWTNDCSTTTVYDSTPYSRSGKSCPAGSGPLGGAAGKFSNAGNFDRVNDNIILSNLSVNTAAGGKNSVSFWMFWDGVQGGMPFGWQQPYDLWLTSNCFGFNTGQGNVFGFSSAGLANRWAHVVAVFYNGVPDAVNNAIYIDGNLQTLTACLATTTVSRSVTTTAQISGWANSSGYYFGGRIDDFRIYNRGLTPEEAGYLYNSFNGCLP